MPSKEVVTFWLDMGAPISLLPLFSARLRSQTVARAVKCGAAPSRRVPGCALAPRGEPAAGGRGRHRFPGAGPRPIVERSGEPSPGPARRLPRDLREHAMIAFIRNLLRPADEDGQGLAEYALILALIAIVAIVALIFLGSQISGILWRL